MELLPFVITGHHSCPKAADKKPYLVLGLSGLMYRVSGADISLPKAIRKREQVYCLEFLDSGKDDECQVAGMGKQLYVCIWSFRLLGRIEAYALDKLWNGRLDGLFKEEVHG